MSAVMVSMAVLIRTFSSGILGGKRRSIKENLENFFLIHRCNYILLSQCIVYDKLLKPRQSFRITLYVVNVKNMPIIIIIIIIIIVIIIIIIIAGPSGHAV